MWCKNKNVIVQEGYEYNEFVVCMMNECILRKYQMDITVFEERCKTCSKDGVVWGIWMDFYDLHYNYEYFYED